MDSHPLQPRGEPRSTDGSFRSPSAWFSPNQKRQHVYSFDPGHSPPTTRSEVKFDHHPSRPSSPTPRTLVTSGGTQDIS